MNRLVKRVFVGVNSRWYASSAERMSVVVRPPFDEVVIEGRGQGVAMLVGGWRRMMTTTEVAEKKNESSDPMADAVKYVCSDGVAEEKDIDTDLGYSPEDLTSSDRFSNLFESWMRKHGKAYESSKEKMDRFIVFKCNVALIHSLNSSIPGCHLGLTSRSDKGPIIQIRVPEDVA